MWLNKWIRFPNEEKTLNANMQQNGWCESIFGNPEDS